MPNPIRLLETLAFVDLLAVSLIIPLIPHHVRNLGGNHLVVGLLGSVYAGFQFGSGPLIGSLSDIKGQKIILIITILVCGLTYALMGVTTSVVVILLLRAVLGLFKQTQLLTRALVPDYEKNEDKQAEIYGKIAAISSAGITLGPVIGGHIVEDFPDGFLFIALAVGFCFVLNAGIAYLLPNTKRRPPRRKAHSNSTNNLIHSVAHSIKESFVKMCDVGWSEYWDIFLFKALVSFAMGVYYSSYALYLKTQFDLSPKYVGYVISFQGIVGAISSYFMGYINSFYTHDKDYSLRNLHVFILLNLSLLGLIASWNVFIYVIWLIPLAIGNAIGRLVTLEMILKRSHGKHRGTLIGASNSVRSLTGVIAPMMAGFVNQFFGVSYVIYASFCSTLIGFVLSCHYRNKIKSD